MESYDVIYKDKDLEVRILDILKLTNGMYVGVSHPQIFITPDEVKSNPILVTTHPISSCMSTIYIEHIDHVVARFDNYDDYHKWWFDNGDLVNKNPLFIKLEPTEV